MARRKNYYPMPPIPAGLTSESDKGELDDVLARLQWRSGLDDITVRSMAADYLRGERDECNTDAFAEYEHRFGKVSRDQAKRGKTSASLRPPKSRYRPIT